MKVISFSAVFSVQNKENLAPFMSHQNLPLGDYSHKLLIALHHECNIFYHETVYYEPAKIINKTGEALSYQLFLSIKILARDVHNVLRCHVITPSART